MEVDSSRIALWGTSFAGGHVLVKGAQLADDWRIRAIVSQAWQPRCCEAEATRRGRVGKQSVRRTLYMAGLL